MAEGSGSDPEVLFEVIGRAGVITLNRPQALNALTLGMVDEIAAALDHWQDASAIAHLIIRQGQSRAFCAGGDIRTLVNQINAAQWDEVGAFYAREYRLNRRIKRYPKPYTALIDGIVMGGGVGVSVHGRYRVGSDRMVFAMPEVGIGLFPDVGGTYFLPRMPGKTGLYLALTGERIKAADALFAGVATHHVPSSDFCELFEALTAAADPAPVLAAFHRDPGRAALAARQDELDRLLAAPSLKELMAELSHSERQSEAAAGALYATLAARSPTSLAIAFRQIAEGQNLDFEACMRLEYRIVSRIVRGHDFREGVRAVIFDKDNAPHWRPPRIEKLDDAVIAAHFESLGTAELEFQ